MDDSIRQSNNASVKPRLIELINRMSEHQCDILLRQLEDCKPQDRRTHPRTSCSMPVDCATGDQSFKGFIKDISAGGVFIETRGDLTVGKEIILTFSSPHQQAGVRIAGEVVRKNALGVGVKFKKAIQGLEESTWLDCRRITQEVSEERRIDPRAEFRCPVIIEGISNEQSVVDISLGGTFIQCDSALARRFQQGEAINLSMKLPTEDRVIKAKAKVACVTEEGIGCKFVEMGKRSQEAIEQCYNLAKHTLPIL